MKEKNFILQEFVPGLNHDYRLLIFYDKYYVMRRYAKKNDFRASGTKIHEFDIEFDYRLLDYGREVYHKFDTPFLSLDIGFHQDNFFLFEFQALHFGINVLIKSVGYYTYNDKNWNINSHQGRPEIETEIANALVKYLRARYQY